MNVIPFSRPIREVDSRMTSSHLALICSFIWRVSDTLKIPEEDVEELLSEKLGINGVSGLQAKDFDPALRCLIELLHTNEPPETNGMLIQ